MANINTTYFKDGKVTIGSIKNILFDEIKNLMDAKKKSNAAGLIINDMYRVIDALRDLEFDLDKQKRDDSFISSMINELKNRIDGTKNESNSYYEKHGNQLEVKYRTILSALKFGLPISEDNFESLINLFDSLEIDRAHQIKMLELIRFHNSKLSNDSNEYRDTVSTLNVLDTGYELFEEPEMDDADRKRMADECGIAVSVISNSENNPEFINLALEGYEMHYSNSEFKSILIGLLKYYQEKMFEQVGLLTDKDFYLDAELKSMIKREYFNYINVYNIVRNYHDHLITPVMSVSTDGENKTGTGEVETKNILLYSRNKRGDSYIEADLKANRFPREYYDKVLDLLYRFKSGETKPGELKKISKSPQDNTVCLIKDQVVISLLHISGNNYCVLGAGVKKSDVDHALFDRLLNRPAIDVDQIDAELEFSKEIEKKFFGYCMKYSRKGTR